MSEISNITPAAIPALRSQSFNVTGESSQTTGATVNPVAMPLSPASVSTQTTGSEQSLSTESVHRAVVVGNAVLQAASKNLQFQVDEATKQVVVKIVDSKTGEVVRQIPTVEMLDFIRAMKEIESNTGKLYSDKA